jgi:hypothetical protein
MLKEIEEEINNSNNRLVKDVKKKIEEPIKDVEKIKLNKDAIKNLKEPWIDEDNKPDVDIDVISQN